MVLLVVSTRAFAFFSLLAFFLLNLYFNYVLMKFWTARNGFFNLLQKQRFLLSVFSLFDWYELLKFSSQYLMTVSSNVEAGATAEKDHIWRAAKEKVWDARRLWMGRRVTRMVQRGQSLLVAWKQGLQPQSLMPNATPLLFLGGFQNLSLPLVIIYNFFSSPIFFFHFLFSCKRICMLVVQTYGCHHWFINFPNFLYFR